MKERIEFLKLKGQIEALQEAAIEESRVFIQAFMFSKWTSPKEMKERVTRIYPFLEKINAYADELERLLKTQQDFVEAQKIENDLRYETYTILKEKEKV